MLELSKLGRWFKMLIFLRHFQILLFVYHFFETGLKLPHETL